MKVLTPMMAKISQKMMHTVNTLKILGIVMINHDPILLENERKLWKMVDDDFLAFPHLGKAPTRALTTTFMPSIFAIALGIETVMDMLMIVMMNNVDACDHDDQ